MLMIFTMISSAWCCGVRSNSFNDARNNVPVAQPINVQPVIPTPPPAPTPQTFVEELTDNIGDFNKFNRDDSESRFDENAERVLGRDDQGNLNLQDLQALEDAFTLATFDGDTDETREERNKLQAEIAKELAPQFIGEINNFLNDVNNDVSLFATENDALLKQVGEEQLEAYYGQVASLTNEFIRDISVAVRDALGTNALNGVNPQTGETSDLRAQIAAFNEGDAPDVNDIFSRLQFTTQDYKNDFTSVREAAVTNIQNLIDQQANNRTTSINTNADFDSALDTSFKSPTQTNTISFQVLNPVNFPGRFDRGQSSIISMITELRDNFAGTALADDLQFFLDTFPPASESVVQSAIEQDGELFLTQGDNRTIGSLSGLDLDPNNTNKIAGDDVVDTFSTQTFDIGLDGRLVGVDASERQVTQTVTTIVSDVSSISGDSRGFNTRKFGGTAGTKESVSIIINETEFVLADNVFTSPIVIDMDGDGKLEASGGVYLPHVYKDGRIVEFDMNGDGFVDLSEWVGKNDGILVQYDASKPLNGAQFFGDVDGFINGYEKLRSLDADENGVLENSELAGLSVWQDKNTNAKLDAGEMKSLEELKITQISVEHDNFVSSCVMDGQDVTMWDWYPSIFEVKKKK